MDASLPVTVPAPYKNQRGWLIAFGVVEILIGCLFLLMIVFSAFAFLRPAAAKIPPNAMPAGSMSGTTLMALVAIQYGLMAAVFFTGGIGSILCKNWARILMLVVCGFWLGIGVITTPVIAFMAPVIMRQQPGNVDPQIQRAIMVGMTILMTALTVVLPAIFLFFYSRKSVRATCLAHKGPAGAAAATGRTGLPVPLAILAVWQGFGVFTIFAFLFARVTFLFGVIIHGAATFLILLTYSVVSGYAAWSIFRQKLIGWYVALFITGFGILNILVTYLRHFDMMQFYREMGLNAQTLHLYDQFPQMLPMVWVSMILGITLFLIFLLYTRKFFPPKEQG